MTSAPRPQTTPSAPVSVPPTRTGGNLIKTLRILTLAAAGMAMLLAILPAAGHDQLWFLLMAQRWLDGALLYGPQLFDSNPPLIVWVSAVPVTLARLLHLPGLGSAAAVGKLLVLLLEAASAALSLRLLRQSATSSGSSFAPAAPLTRSQTAWLAFAWIAIFALIPARDFGQRDHLTAVLILPYILAAALPPALGPGPLTRTAAGLLAAVGICLKPHQALIPVAVELTLLVLLLRRGSQPHRASATHPLAQLHPRLRPEPLTIVLSGLLFLAAIHRFTPAYFTLALPTLRDTYWAIGHLTPLQLLAQSPQLHLLAAVVLLLSFRRHHSSAITLLIAAALAATAAFYLQGTGWYYQQLPAISLFAAALALQLLPLLARLPDRTWPPRAAAGLAILALALTAHFSGYPFTPDRAYNIATPDPAFFRSLPPGTPVAMITTSVDDTMMPTARFGLLWSQRTNNVWTLPAVLRSEAPQGTPPRHTISPARLVELRDQQHRWMVEDLTDWRPQLILVARCQSPEVHCQELEDRHDDLLAWFRQDPAFRQLWSHYRYARTSGPYDAYILATGD